MVNVAPAIAFVWFTLGAVANFVAPAGKRDVRTQLLALLFWGMIVATTRAPHAPFWLSAIGLVAVIGALVLFQWASYSIRGRNFFFIFSADVPAFLHTAGPYRYVRNPFYASYLLALIATASMRPSLLTGAIAVGSLVYLDRAARFEERKFEASPLRDEYLAYKSRTGRFLPNLF